MLLMTSKGFRQRKDRTARQEFEDREEAYGEDPNSPEERAETPEQRLERQSPPDPEDEKAQQPLILRIWRAIMRR